MARCATHLNHLKQMKQMSACCSRAVQRTRFPYDIEDSMSRGNPCIARTVCNTVPTHGPKWSKKGSNMDYLGIHVLCTLRTRVHKDTSCCTTSS